MIGIVLRMSEYVVGYLRSCMQSPTQFYISYIPPTIITMDVANFFSLAGSDDSDDEEIVTAVGGAILRISSPNASPTLWNRTVHQRGRSIVDLFFARPGENSIMRELTTQSCWITCYQMLFMVRNLR